MRFIRVVAFFLVFTSFAYQTAASETRVFLDVHRVELNNKGKPIKRSYSYRSSYTLLNLNTGEHRVVHKAGTAKGSELQLSDGIWCMRSVALTGSQYLSVVNPLCFKVDGTMDINAGTWVVGWRFDAREVFAGILEVKENFDELANSFAVKEYVVPGFFALDPKRLNEAKEQLRQADSQVSGSEP